MCPDLTSYRWIVVNSSAGKDSQAMLDFVVERCDHVHVPRDHLVVAHADLGRVEWPGTRELAEEGCAIMWRDIPFDSHDPATWTKPAASTATPSG